MLYIQGFTEYKPTQHEVGCHRPYSYLHDILKMQTGSQVPDSLSLPVGVSGSDSTRKSDPYLPFANILRA